MMKKFILSLSFLILLLPSKSQAGDTVVSDDKGKLIIYGAGGTNAGGATVQIDEFSGAATWSLQIPTLPARGGLSPNLVLNYNSYRRNSNSWVGYGWELDVGSIQRTASDDGTIDYLNGTSFEARFAGQTESLQLVQEGVDASAYGFPPFPTVFFRADLYHAKIESSFTLFFHIYVPFAPGFSSDRWVAIDKSGLRYTFGDSFVGEDSGGWEKIPEGGSFRWMLTRIEDANGNTLKAAYGATTGLLDTITYNDIIIDFWSGEIKGGSRFFPDLPRRTFLYGKGPQCFI